ncbi:MAG: folate-binding protein [Pseudomonadota bacterium]
MTARRILRLTGGDVDIFLQGLITNDIARLDAGIVYTALLTPQGKYLADFFLSRDGDGVLLDADEDLSDSLIKRLSMYKLRADVTITKTDLVMQRGTGPAPDGALPDPRHAALGWRRYVAEPTDEEDDTDWDALRVAHCIPETGVELTPDTFILEAGFEALNGVDFKKGCFVGQEVTARMKHKTKLRKGLRVVSIDGTAPVGTDIMSNGKPAGTLLTQSGDRAIAYLRFDRMSDAMEAGDATVRGL